MEPQYDVTDMDNFYLSEENRALRAQRDELLGTLKALANDYERVCGDGMTESNQPDVMRAARAAIAKTEGSHIRDPRRHVHADCPFCICEPTQ